MQDLPEIFLLRHGETVWNRAGRFQGHSDSPLTPRGERQAISMGQALCDLGVGAVHRWISSPAPRALRTATLARGAPPDRTDDRLSEIAMGDWQGLTRAQIDARWPGPPGEGMMAFYARVPGGEPLASVADRARAFLAALDQPAVLVTHGLTSRILRGLLLDLHLPALDTLPGGHGAIFRCTRGRVELAAAVERLPDAPPGSIAAV